MTAAGGHLNRPPLFQFKLLKSHIPPPSFLASTCLGFTSFEAQGQGSVDLPGRHSNSRQHQMSRDLADHDRSGQTPLVSLPLPFWRAEEAGQGERAVFW